jgi:hypothetical protein
MLSSVGGRNPFRQGVLQTVHDTWQGLDAKTGRSSQPDARTEDMARMHLTPPLAKHIP